MKDSGSAGVFEPLRADDPRTVAGYRLRARLGAGGMGKVYLSYTPGGRAVAIKVIRPEFSGDTEFRRRFTREVHAAERVQGLFTAPVIDYDTEGDQPWLATAYVPGPSLVDAVREHGGLPVATVLLMVAGIAEALQVIHGAGIVHRDLKPSNVLLAADGPRVIDFGIARAADATSLTASGVAVGTPTFMAPEQAAGTAITPATDIFALGQVTAYASIGSPAFGEGTAHGVLYRIVHETPDLTGLPAELRELVTGCLAKEAERRPSVADILRLCREASAVTQLRRPEDWLPTAVAADITLRSATPEPSGPVAVPEPPPIAPAVPQSPPPAPAVPQSPPPAPASPPMPVTSPPAAPPAAPAGGGGMAGPPPAAPPGPARAGHSARPAAESPYQAPAEPPEPEAPAPSVGHGAKAPTGGPATPGTESGTAGPESREETGGADSAAGRQPGTRPVPVGSPAAPPGGYGPPRYSTTQLATPAEAPYPAPRVPGAPAGGEKAATTATGPKRGRAKVVALAVAGVLVFAAAGGGTAYALLHGGDASTRADAGPTGDASTDPPTQPSDEPSGEPSAGGESSKSAVPNPEPVEHDGINLPADYHLYFASDSATPRNDQDDSAPDLTYRDSFGDKSLETSDGSKLVLLNNAQQGGLETCRQETRFADSIDFDRISKGSRVCVRTGSGHIALVTFKGFAPDSDPSDYITIDLTLWRNALDAESAS